MVYGANIFSAWAREAENWRLSFLVIMDGDAWVVLGSPSTTGEPHSWRHNTPGDWTGQRSSMGWARDVVELKPL